MLGLGADIPKGGCGVEPTHDFCLLAAGCLLFSQSYNGPLPGAAQPEHMDLFFFSSAVREIEGRNWRNYPPRRLRFCSFSLFEPFAVRNRPDRRKNVGGTCRTQALNHRGFFSFLRLLFVTFLCVKAARLRGTLLYQD